MTALQKRGKLPPKSNAPRELSGIAALFGRFSGWEAST